MITKLFEVRDDGTHIPCIAIRISGDDGWLARHAGYGKNACILFGALSGGNLRYDPYDWRGRTMPTAHHFIIDNFDHLEDGQVIDVRFILKETEAPCESEYKG